ncbi:hypothetical protein RND81_02G086500 [Saponaria officinalis]|uniref:Basic blue protein n=1 Tax=Saponaria officinalis TaxID=3572 RepID=A0AAW1MV80_SAPOF
MVMGRGSAKQVMVVGIAILCIMAMTHPTLAAVYNVGGSTGWSYNAFSWPNGKTLRAGDVLVFKYNKSQHNVASVGQSGYNRCTISKRTKVYRSGSDKFKLKKGINYFICAVPGHCKAGMKIAIKAL